MTNVNGTLFFSANNGMSGRELWKSDGTANGTVLVKDIAPGSATSDSAYLMNVGGALFFRANDDVNGIELWKSDGTANGTVLVKDIRAGLFSSYPHDLTNVNGTVFFSADDGVNGRELWQSDATANGTFLVENINPGAAAWSPFNLANVNGTLYFVADDGVHGLEPWLAAEPAPPPPPATETRATIRYADWNNDGVRDLFFLKQDHTGSGSTEVHILAGPDFTTFLLHAATPLHETDATWTFDLGDFNRDGIVDVWGIKKNTTGSNTTEIHILNGANSSQSFLLHTTTGLHETDATWDFQVARFNNDVFLDVVAFHKSNTGSGKTEMHVLDGATTFQSFAAHIATGLHTIGAEAVLRLADFDFDGVLDLAYIKKFGTGSGTTELHVLPGGTGYQTFSIQTPTALHETGDEAEFDLFDRDGDNRPDLVYTKKFATGSGKLEVHILSGISYQLFLAHLVTALDKTRP